MWREGNNGKGRGKTKGEGRDQGREGRGKIRERGVKRKTL